MLVAECIRLFVGVLCLRADRQPAHARGFAVGEEQLNVTPNRQQQQSVDGWLRGGVSSFT